MGARWTKEGEQRKRGCSPVWLWSLAKGRLLRGLDRQDADEVVGGVEDAGYGDLLAEKAGSEALIIQPEEAGVGGVA